MLRNLRRTLRLAKKLRDPHFCSKADQWQGSSWAREQIFAGRVHHVEFVLDASAYDRDAHDDNFLRGARDTLISMLMEPEVAAYVIANTRRD